MRKSSRRSNGRNKLCKYCHVSYVDPSVKNTRKYCSKKCKRKEYARIVVRDKKCQLCGRDFVDNSRLNNFSLCSKFCRKRMTDCNRYNITNEEYEKLISVSNCQLCHKLFKKKRDIQIDHCHETGKIRGVLCRVCNVSIGGLGDSIKGLQSAITYLGGT